MLTSFRRLSKSVVGRLIAALFLIAILASFAISDISNFGSGSLGFGLGDSTLAEVGKYRVTDREMSDVMQRRLSQVRLQNPNATYADIAADFEEILDELIDQKTLFAFADKYGFRLSKRLIDADIATLPGVTSFNGKVVGGVLEWATDAGVPHVAVIAGQVTSDAREELAVHAGAQLLALTDRVWQSAEAFSRAPVLVEEAALEAGRGVTDADA